MMWSHTENRRRKRQRIGEKGIICQGGTVFIRHSSVSNAVDDSTRELYDYVSRVKMQPEVRESYMRLDEIIETESVETFIKLI